MARRMALFARLDCASASALPVHLPPHRWPSCQSVLSGRGSVHLSYPRTLSYITQLCSSCTANDTQRIVLPHSVHRVFECLYLQLLVFCIYLLFIAHSTQTSKIILLTLENVGLLISVVIYFFFAFWQLLFKAKTKLHSISTVFAVLCVRMLNYHNCQNSNAAQEPQKMPKTRDHRLRGSASTVLTATAWR